MHLRVNVTGFKEPHCFMTTLHKSTVFDANTLRHVIPRDHLHTLFPDGAGIHFDFSESGKVTMCPQQDVTFDFAKEPMRAGEKHGLELGHVKILTLGSAHVRFEIVGSNFPGELIKKKKGSHEIAREKMAAKKG